MLVFVVPLQSPEVSRDWSLVSRLTRRTLGSLCGQTSPEFHVILVCNQRPEGFEPHPQITLIEEPFPVPAPGSGREPRMIDKFRKLQRGLIEARTHTPCHLMIVDADDCVSRRLAEWCARHRHDTGWYFDTGYVHDEGSHWAFRKKLFHEFCGSSAIFRAEREDLPSTMDVPHGENFYLSHAHPIFTESMAKRGTPLAPLPFPGAVYITGTGENDSRMHYGQLRSRRLLLQKILHARYVTRGFRREFGLRDL